MQTLFFSFWLEPWEIGRIEQLPHVSTQWFSTSPCSLKMSVMTLVAINYHQWLLVFPDRWIHTPTTRLATRLAGGNPHPNSDIADLMISPESSTIMSAMLKGTRFFGQNLMVSKVILSYSFAPKLEHPPCCYNDFILLPMWHNIMVGSGLCTCSQNAPFHPLLGCRQDLITLPNTL